MNEELKEIFGQLTELNDRGELCGVGIVVSSHKGKHTAPKLELITLGDISQQQIIGVARKNEQQELIEMLAKLAPHKSAELVEGLAKSDPHKSEELVEELAKLSTLKQQ